MPGIFENLSFRSPTLISPAFSFTAAAANLPILNPAIVAAPSALALTLAAPWSWSLLTIFLSAAALSPRWNPPFSGGGSVSISAAPPSSFAGHLANSRSNDDRARCSSDMSTCWHTHTSKSWLPRIARRNFCAGSGANLMKPSSSKSVCTPSLLPSPRLTNC